MKGGLVMSNKNVFTLILILFALAIIVNSVCTEDKQAKPPFGRATDYASNVYSCDTIKLHRIHNQFVWRIDNTDSIVIMFKTSGKEHFIMVNTLNKNYPNVLFNNGVPDNAVDIYDKLFSLGKIGNYVTDYTTGNKLIIEEVESGDSFTINLD